MAEISHRLWLKAGALRLPLGGSFELLPTCNLRCKMCYVRKSPAEVQALGGLLPTEQWLTYAREIRDAGSLFLLLTGGEPFLHQDLQEILVKSQEYGLLVSINSNGTLIDHEMARWLSHHKPTRMNITLYGASAETYQRLCGDGNAYDRLRRAVEWLKQYDIPVKFNTSVTPDNVGDLEAMISFAKSVQSPIQAATYMFPPLRRDPDSVGSNFRLSPDAAARARVEADWLQGDQKWFLGQASRFSHFVPPTEEMFSDSASRPAQEIHCRAGRCSFWIDWQGNMSNCGMYPAVKFPMQGRSFRDAWRQVVEETNQVRFAPACTGCPNFPLCHTCIAMVCNECGDPNGRPEYLCRYNEASARYYAEYAKRIDPAQHRDASDAAPVQLPPDLCGLDV